MSRPFCDTARKENNMATIMIGSARINERGKLSGGVAGDQKQVSSANDTKGEVSMQPFYVHSKGWYILRPKDAVLAAKMAERMTAACNNKNIGYDQGNRLGVIIYGINTKTKTECDCSSLTRQVVKEASGKDPGNFTTANAVSLLIVIVLHNESPPSAFAEMESSRHAKPDHRREGIPKDYSISAAPHFR